MSLIFFALNCCPLTALHASGPKCCTKNNVEKISKFVKMPHWPPSCFPLCVWTWSRLNGAIAPPPPLQTRPASFHYTMWCPCCVESNRALRRREPVWQAPKTSSLLKTLVSNVVFALGVFHIQSSCNIYIVGYDFNFCVTGNNASVAFKINLFSSAIFYQCFELKSNEKIIFQIVTKNDNLLN